LIFYRLLSSFKCVQEKDGRGKKAKAAKGVHGCFDKKRLVRETGKREETFRNGKNPFPATFPSRTKTLAREDRGNLEEKWIG